MFRTFIITAAAALTLAGAASAQAVDPSAQPSISIRYSDLDLKSEDGAKAMAARIQTAADAVCGQRPDPMLLDRRAAFDTCHKATVERALDQLHAPLVTAMAGQSTTVLIAGR